MCLHSMKHPVELQDATLQQNQYQEQLTAAQHDAVASSKLLHIIGAGTGSIGTLLTQPMLAFPLIATSSHCRLWTKNSSTTSTTQPCGHMYCIDDCMYIMQCIHVT